MGGIERNVEPCRGEAPKQGKSLNPNCPPVGPKSLKTGSKNQKTLVAVRGFSCTFAGRRPCLTDAIVRTQPQPGNEMVLRFPFAHIPSRFANDGGRGHHIDTVDPG